MEFQKILEKSAVKVSVPCRVDAGGTLDISTFYIPLTFLSPSCFNIAMDMRTVVTLLPWKENSVKVSSRGFDSIEFESKKAPYDHPLGLICAVADYFDAGGVHIHIDSSSPPKSALGGSSAAAVAVVAAFYSAAGRPVVPEDIAWTAHYIESSVAGVPCGMQDQLAAAFGGVNQWYWRLENGRPAFERKEICRGPEEAARLNSSIIVAYCGMPHVSRDVNSQWVSQFIRGENRERFEKIVRLTERFSNAVRDRDYTLAAETMREETDIRLEMTPEVLDKTGKILFEMAGDMKAGARFTGAGGGGCVWAVGEPDKMIRVRNEWARALESVADAAVLDMSVDIEGIIYLSNTI